MRSDDPFVKRNTWQQEETAGGTPRSPATSMMPVIIVGAVLGLAVVGIAFSRRPSERVTASPTTAPAILVATPTINSAPPTPLPTATPVNLVAQGYLASIIELEKRNKWQAAADTAESARSDPTVGSDFRPTFAQKYVTDALEALYATPFDPGKATQEDAVTRYQTLVRKATEYNVAPPRPLTIANRAAQSGLFLVVIAAYNDAWQRQDFTASDMALVKDYVSNLYNIGDWWTRNPTSPAYDEGLTYLATSWQVANRYKTGQAESWMRLRELLGTNEADWPKPMNVPLLTP